MLLPEGEVSAHVQLLTPLLRIVKDKESLYLELLNFVGKSIDSTSNQLNQLYLFGEFLECAQLKLTALSDSEAQLLTSLEIKSNPVDYWFDRNDQKETSYSPATLRQATQSHSLPTAHSNTQSVSSSQHPINTQTSVCDANINVPSNSSACDIQVINNSNIALTPFRTSLNCPSVHGNTNFYNGGFTIQQQSTSPYSETTDRNSLTPNNEFKGNSPQKVSVSMSFPKTKQLLRLFSRVLQIMESSLARTAKTFYSDHAKLQLDFMRLKKGLQRLLSSDLVSAKELVTLVLANSSSKIERHLTNIKKYLFKLDSGDRVSFKDIYYYKDGSDASGAEENHHSHSQKKQTHPDKFNAEASGSESPTKKITLRRPLPKGSILKEKKKMTPETSGQCAPSEQASSRASTAHKLYKFYSFIELNKKEFLQDYIYEEKDIESQKNRIFNQLIEKNKLVNQQINGFIKKVANYEPQPIVHDKKQSSGDESVPNRNDSVLSAHITRKTSFIISKRRQSFAETQTQPGEKPPQPDILRQETFTRTLKSFMPKRRSSQSNTSKQTKSKRLFVVKAPMVFEDEMIPQVAPSAAWGHQPLTGRATERRGENLRLKRRNNPIPLKGQSFQAINDMF